MDCKRRKPHESSPKQEMAASCVGALLTSLSMTPLDVVKVRLQAQQREKLKSRCFLYCNGLMDHICSCQPSTNRTQKLWYSQALPKPINGTLDGLIKIARHEGIPSLWSGLPPTLLIAVPSTVIYFTAYEQIKKTMGRYPQFQNESGQALWWVPGISGGIARLWSVTLSSPVELVRTKLQASRLNYADLLVQMRKETKVEGVRSLWKGWVPTVLRDVPFSVIYWVIYDSLKRASGEEHLPSVPFTIAGGACAGAVAATLTLPLDVVKTHRQIEIASSTGSANKPRKSTSGSTLRQLENIYTQQGVRGLFSGLSPRLVKVMPACAVMISTYEYIKTYSLR